MRRMIDKVIQVMITVIMAVMVTAVCWQVFTRYVLKNPSTVTEEALRYLLVWTTMVGAAYAYGRRKHLAITVFAKRLSPKNRLILDTLIQVLVIGFCVVVMIMGGMNLQATAQGMVSAALGIPMQYVYSSLLVGAVLFIFYAVLFIRENIEKLSGEHSTEEGHR